MTFGKNEYLLSFWEETAKFFLLGGGVQLIFSYNLLYKDIYTPETLSFIPLGGKSEVFPTQSPIEFLFLFIVYGYLYPWYLVFYLTITMTTMRPIFLSVNFFVLIQNIVHFRPVKKKNGEPRQKAAFCRGRGSQNSATATKKCRPLRRPRQISKWGAAGIGDRDKNVSPTSATATDFRVRGGRYRRPRQKSAAHFGDRDRFQSKGRPVSATATKKCRQLRRPRQISK